MKCLSVCVLPPDLCFAPLLPPPEEKFRLLELGAAVYVIKPFGIGELIALARAALQPRIGTTSANDPIVRVGALQINLAPAPGR